MCGYCSVPNRPERESGPWSTFYLHGVALLAAALANAALQHRTGDRSVGSLKVMRLVDFTEKRVEIMF